MFPHDDVVVNNAIVLDVGNRSKATFENIYALLERFPGIVEEDEVTTLENEFLEDQLLDDIELPDTIPDTGLVRDFRDEKLCDWIKKVPYTGKIHYSDTTYSTQQCGL